MWNSNGIQIVKNGFGTYYEYYPNGTLKVKGEIKEGERFGIWKWYYDNGTVMLEGTYLNYSHRFKIFNAYYKTGDSQLCNGNGDFILHFPNSPIIAMSANYLNGQLEGETRYYWPNGTLMKLCNYNIGSLNGKFESYYSNGKINSSGKYFEGRPYGIWKKYDKDGRLYFDQLIK
jgi:antitoxin component YwqK of YwqJK toxin-antitoxin module